MKLFEKLKNLFRKNQVEIPLVDTQLITIKSLNFVSDVIKVTGFSDLKFNTNRSGVVEASDFFATLSFSTHTNLDWEGFKLKLVELNKFLVSHNLQIELYMYSNFTPSTFSKVSRFSKCDPLSLTTSNFEVKGGTHTLVINGS